MNDLESFPSLESCDFYHVMDLPGFGTQGGPISWDLRGRFDDYIAHLNIQGKAVLDVGAASGFLSFEAERSGAATVTSFDVASADQYQYLPYPNADENRKYFQTIRNSYVFAHHAFRSNARLITGDISQLSKTVEPHDISIVGQILVHLRDPLEAIRQVSLVTKERMIITEGSFESEAPIAVFLGGKGNHFSWWHLSDKFYREYLPILGFEIESATKADYRCNDSRLRGDVTLWTFVAKRSSQTRPLPFSN
jgi:hypothetical protein